MNRSMDLSSKSGITSMFAYLPLVNQQTMSNPFEIPIFNDIEMFINSMSTSHYHQFNFNLNKLNKEEKKISIVNSIIISSGQSYSSYTLSYCIPSLPISNQSNKLRANEICSDQPFSIGQMKEQKKCSNLSLEKVLGSLNLQMIPLKEPFKIAGVMTYKEKGKCLKICNIIKILGKYFKFCGKQNKVKRLMKALRIESAYKLGMRKKTLDDYAMFLKWGIRLDFPFKEHMNKKFGFLRKWVRLNPRFSGKKTTLRHEFNSVNLVEEIQKFNSSYLKQKK